MLPQFYRLDKAYYFFQCTTEYLFKVDFWCARGTEAVFMTDWMNKNLKASFRINDSNHIKSFPYYDLF